MAKKSSASLAQDTQPDAKNMFTRAAEPTTKMHFEIKALEALSNDDIDTGDIPESSLENMMAGKRDRFFRPNKDSITIRLDADLLDWFKSGTEGSGYQTEINRVLRRHMIESIKNKG